MSEQMVQWIGGINGGSLKYRNFNWSPLQQVVISLIVSCCTPDEKIWTVLHYIAIKCYKRKRDDRPNQNRPGDIHGIPVRNAALRLLLALSEALPKVGVLDQSDQCCRDLVTTCCTWWAVQNKKRWKCHLCFSMFVLSCWSFWGQVQLQKEMKLRSSPLSVSSALVDFLRRFTWLFGVYCGLHDAPDFGQASVEAWPRRGTEVKKNGQGKTAFQKQ